MHKIAILLALAAAGLSGQSMSDLTLVQRNGQPGKTCYEDNTPAPNTRVLCLSIPSGALAQAAATLRLPQLPTADNQFLTATQSGVMSWAPIPGSTPAGSDMQVQFNRANLFGASSNLVYNYNANLLIQSGGAGTGMIANAFNSTAGGPAVAFQTGGGTSQVFGGGWAAYQSVNTLGVTAAQGTSTPQGGYVRWTPVLYPPNGGPVCHDVYGNVITIPTPAPGDAPFGPNDLILWNGTSPVWSSTCMGPALPTQLDYGLNLNGYFLAHDLASFGQSFASGAIYSPDGKITGGWQGAAFYAGALYPGNTLLISIQDADSVHGTHMNNRLHSPGTLYNPGDTGLVNGAATTAATYKVLTTSGGGVSTYSITAPGNGYSIPATNVATTSTTGSGSGFTIDLTGLTGSLYLAGASYLGHSCGPPSANPSGAATIQNSTNPMPIGLGLQQGLHYYDDCLHTMRYLQDDLVTWVSYPGSAGAVPGVDTNIIFNNAGSFGAAAQFFYDYTNGILNVAHVGSTSGIVSPLFNANLATCVTHAFQTSTSSWFVDCAGNTEGQNIVMGGSTYNAIQVINGGGVAASVLTVGGIAGNPGPDVLAFEAPTSTPALSAAGTANVYTDGTNLKMSIGGGAYVNIGSSSGCTVPGANTQVMFNDGGSCGASANLTFNKTTSVITLANASNNVSGIASPIFNGIQSGRSSSDHTFQNANSNYAVTVHGDVAGQSLTLAGLATTGIIYNVAGLLETDNLFTWNDATFVAEIADPSSTSTTAAWRAPDLVCSNDLAVTPASTNCIQSSGGTFQIRGSGDFLGQTFTFGSVPLTSGAGQVSFGNAVTTASHCGSLSGSAGCYEINVAGTTRYIPYY